jgi:hypothetical protein
MRQVQFEGDTVPNMKIGIGSSPMAVEVVIGEAKAVFSEPRARGCEYGSGVPAGRHGYPYTAVAA